MKPRKPLSIVTGPAYLYRRLLICLSLAGFPMHRAPAQIPAWSLAATYCEAVGTDSVRIRSLIDMAVLRHAPPEKVEEIELHEEQHQADLMANPRLCFNRTAEEFLAMETTAYCVSDAVPVRHGARSDSVYFHTLEILVGQFEAHLSREVVLRAWLARCGKMLGLRSSGPP